jgi:hypothetical protein
MENGNDCEIFARLFISVKLTQDPRPGFDRAALLEVSEERRGPVFAFHFSLPSALFPRAINFFRFFPFASDDSD